MKKICALILALIMAGSMFGCGGDSEIKDGDISREESNEIAEPEKSDDVVAAEAAVKAIGNVTLESGVAIETAEKAVQELSTKDKEMFSMNAELKAAREKYDTLVAEKEISDVRVLINNIGEVTLASGDAIEAAEKAYNALSADKREKLDNKDVLKNAKTKLDELKKAEKKKVIAAKAAAFDSEVDKIEGITWYYSKNMPKYVDIRSYIIPQIGVRDNGDAWVMIRYNYTADSWIFWEKLTIMVDGEKYYKYPSRSELTRDNDTEIWEYYNEGLPINADMENTDLKMLQAIAASNETLIRFEGDDYYDDLTVTAADKAMIKETLEFYKVLID